MLHPSTSYTAGWIFIHLRHRAALTKPHCAYNQKLGAHIRSILLDDFAPICLSSFNSRSLCFGQFCKQLSESFWHSHVWVLRISNISLELQKQHTTNYGIICRAYLYILIENITNFCQREAPLTIMMKQAFSYKMMYFINY